MRVRKRYNPHPQTVPAWCSDFVKFRLGLQFKRFSKIHNFHKTTLPKLTWEQAMSPTIKGIQGKVMFLHEESNDRFRKAFMGNCPIILPNPNPIIIYGTHE